MPGTFAEQAGLRLTDTPQALFRLLVLSLLVGTGAEPRLAAIAARVLTRAGLRSPGRLADAGQDEVAVLLGDAGLSRQNQIARRLVAVATAVRDDHHSDLRRLRAAAGQDPRAERRALRDLPGLGNEGADVFLTEVGSVWPEAGPR